MVNTLSIPTEVELARLATGACQQWRDAWQQGRLACAASLKNGTEFIDISGNRRIRHGFIKDDMNLGCKNLRPDGVEFDALIKF